MMRRSTNLVLAVSIGLACSLPGVALAMPVIDSSSLNLKPDMLQKLPLIPPAITGNTEAFCAGFGAAGTEIKKTLQERSQDLIDRLDQSQKRRGERRDARDAKLSDARNSADERRGEWYVRLEERAKGDDQKDAVVAFKQTIEKAVEARREAIDAAITAFRKGVDGLLEKRATEMSAARVAFVSATEKALAQVEQDCQNGETTAAIRKEFKDELKSARETLKADRAKATKVGADVQTLTQTRQASLKKAFADFDATLSSARAELKTALESAE